MEVDRLEVILFDLGGVLVELGGVPKMIDWMDGIDVEGLWQRWLYSPVVRLFEGGKSTPETFADGVIAELNLPVGREEFLREFRLWLTGLYPGVEVLLGKLKGRFKLSCFSNTNELHWPVIRDGMGLGKLLDVNFISYEIGLLKPDLEAFQFIVDSLGCLPGRILFLDDNQLNVDAALSSGIVAHRVSGTEETKAKLESLGVLS